MTNVAPVESGSQSRDSVQTHRSALEPHAAVYGPLGRGGAGQRATVPSTDRKKKQLASETDEKCFTNVRREVDLQTTSFSMERPHSVE